MRKRMRVAATVALACGLGLGLAPATNFTWTDGGATHDWDCSCNWGGTPQGCPMLDEYPSQPADNATFPDNSGVVWLVDLIDETINSVTILEGVTFGAATGHTKPTLNLNTLTIDATAAGGTITVQIGGGATIAIP